MKVSVVVPMFNEATGIVGFLDGQLMPVLNKLSYDVEVILVDDGSVDKTVEKVVKNFPASPGEKPGEAS